MSLSGVAVVVAAGAVVSSVSSFPHAAASRTSADSAPSALTHADVDVLILVPPEFSEAPLNVPRPNLDSINISKAQPASADTDSARARRLGARIRSLRKEGGLTLVELARLTGLSHPFLSQIERGLARPSMNSLHRISEALGTNASRLLAGSENTREASVVRASDTGSIAANDLGETDGVVRVVVPEASPFQVVEFTGAPSDFRDYWVHDGFETVYVISGEVEIDLDGEIFRLGPGDSISYDTSRPHRLRAVAAAVKLLIIETSPHFASSSPQA